MPGGYLGWTTFLPRSVTYTHMDLDAYNAYVGPNGPTECDMGRGDFVYVPNRSSSVPTPVFNGAHTSQTTVQADGQLDKFLWCWVDVAKEAGRETFVDGTPNQLNFIGRMFANKNVWDVRDGRQLLLYKYEPTAPAPPSDGSDGSHWYDPFMSPIWNPGTAPWL